MSLVVFQHVDLLGKLAVTLLTLILFDALVKLHVVPQSVLCLHACRRKTFIQYDYSAKKQKLRCNEVCDAAVRI